MDGSAWVVVATTGLWWCGREMLADGNWKAVGAVAAEERLALWWAALGVVRVDLVPCKENTEVLVYLLCTQDLTQHVSSTDGTQAHST